MGTMSSKSQSRLLESSYAPKDLRIIDTFLDDISSEYDGDLNHAPATPHDTYLSSEAVEVRKEWFEIREKATRWLYVQEA